MLSRLEAAAVVGIAFVLPIVLSSIGPAHGACVSSSTIKIDGAVVHPVTITLNDLLPYPSTYQNIYFNTGAGPTSARYTGLLLWDVLQNIGIQPKPGKNSIIQRYLVVNATDGYSLTVSVGELAPQFGGHQVLLAYKEDDAFITEGFARLVFPGDKAGGRAISCLTSITVY
jgi:DMSO/TMAO reductase YedYZ molybdopterin-dependent catalytic subunit